MGGVAGSVNVVSSFFPSADKSAMSSPWGDIKGFDEDRLRSGGGVGGQSNTTKSLSAPPSNLITTNGKKTTTTYNMKSLSLLKCTEE